MQLISKAHRVLTRDRQYTSAEEKSAVLLKVLAIHGAGRHLPVELIPA